MKPWALILRCERCRIGVEDEEYVTNFGVCDSCFEEYCPCQSGGPSYCPLHSWPDVRLEFS